MNRTKAIIIDAFWQLLEEKPYNKITVKDIVDRCHLNRNTFYYHFHDIPELLEDSIKSELDYIIQTYCNPGSPIDCLTPLVQNTLRRKKSTLHIYRSVQREVFLRYLDQLVLHIVTKYIETVTVGLTLPPEDKTLLIRFYKCALVGVYLDWLDSGLNYDLEKSAIRITELLSGSGKQAILKATEAQIQETAKTQTEQSTETQTDVQSTTVASDAVTIVDDGNGIGVEEAKEIALQNAGLESSEVVFTKEKQDRDGRSVEYDIEFVTDTTKYEYEIKADDGTVLQASQEPIEKLSANTRNDGIIDVDEVKRIVLEDSKFSAEQVAYTKVESDYDDGRTEYEIDFFADGMEYSYTLDASSGKILEKEVERP